MGHLVNSRAGCAGAAEYFLEVVVGRAGRRAEGEGRFVACVLAEGHRWKEVVFIYSFICSTNIK